VERNEEAVRKELAVTAPHNERVSRSLRVLGSLLRSPSYGAELELWAVARTDPRLREVLRRAEGAVKRDLHRVLGDVLGPEATAAPGYPLVAELTVQLLRGMAISEVLRREDADREQLLEQWGRIAGSLLAAAPPAPSAPTGEEESR
jgi:hypothetical protein